MEKIREVLEDQVFCDKLAEATTNEDAIAVFAERGITENELSEYYSTRKDELTESDLDEVSGGRTIGHPILDIVSLAAKLKDCDKRTGKKYCICGWHIPTRNRPFRSPVGDGRGNF